MRKLLTAGLLSACAFAASAEVVWKAGEGVANDHATGANARDVSFVARDASTGYGYRQYTLPIGVTVLAWSVPNFECFVSGVRFNFG